MMSLTDGSKPTLSLKIRRKFEGVNGHFQLKNSQKNTIFPELDEVETLNNFFPD